MSSTSLPPLGPFAPCHKTVVVLDHGPAFSAPCGGTDAHQLLQSNRARKSKKTFVCEKSLWTACVEATVEYNRVVYDLFSFTHRQRYVRFILSDAVARYLTPGNTWLNFPPDSLLEHLGDAGGPDVQADEDSCSILQGISMAVEGLTEATDAQRMRRRQLQSAAKTDGVRGGAAARGAHLRNCGRIVVFTRLGDGERSMAEIEKHLAEQIDSRNNLVKSLDVDLYMPLDEVELCVVDVVPMSDATAAPTSDDERGRRYRPSGRVAAELRRVSAAGQRLFSVAHDMLLAHYGLASTLVAGIPMREETTSGQSVNYDVELLHDRAAQDDLVRSLACRTGVPAAVATKPDANCTYNSITLHWVAPSSKQSDAELTAPSTLALAAHRVTPAAVTSRPSMCLMSFVLNGRTVQLDVPPGARSHMAAAENVTGKLISHLLAAHGGVAYIHALPIARASAVDEPPAISDGAGGRVFDYRMQHFAQLMCQATLVHQMDATPAMGTLVDADTVASVPNAVALANLRTCTEKWPMTSTETIVHNLTRFEPVLDFMCKSTLNDENVSGLNQALSALLNEHLKGEPLANAGQLGSRLKGLKRDEQWRQALNELETCMRPMAGKSDQHCRVFNALREHLRRPPVARADLMSLSASEIFDAALAGDSSRTQAGDVCKQPAPVSTAADNMEIDPNYLLPTGCYTLNVAEYFREKYVRRFWSGWRDFDKRDPDNPKVELYESLRIRQAAEAAAAAAESGSDPHQAAQQSMQTSASTGNLQQKQHSVGGRPPLSGPMAAR